MDYYPKSLQSIFAKGKIEYYIVATMSNSEWYYGDSFRVTIMNLWMHLLNFSAEYLH